MRVIPPMLAAIIALAILAGCSSISSFMADTMPTWMGGLPADVPPRPSDPRHPAYEKAQRDKALSQPIGTPAAPVPASSN